MSDVPPNYRAIAELVAGFVDDKLAEFRAEMIEAIPPMCADVLRPHVQTINHLHGNVSGLIVAVAELQENAAESMPEHVYKQFIRSEAERLRIVKKAVAPTTDPDTSQ